MILAFGITKTRNSWNNDALWTALLLGGVGAIAAIPIELALEKLLSFAALGSFLKAGAMAFFVAGVPEETIKFVILVGAAERDVDARRRQDLIALALAVSLGFATMENLFYVALPAEWQIIAVARALTAVPEHGIDGLMMGALLTAARLSSARQRTKLALALAITTAMHAAYDFPLFALRETAQESAARVSLGALWLTVLTVSALAAIIMCNRTLAAAVQADRHSGRDRRPQRPVLSTAVGGCVMLIASFVLGVGVFSMKNLPTPAIGVVLSIVPAALAIDLLWTAWRGRNQQANVLADEK